MSRVTFIDDLGDPRPGAPLTKNVVLRSIETADGVRCVDLFVRADRTFGFDEFRRDVEDAGWTPIGHHGHLVFHSDADALDAALSKVAWLKDVLGPR